MGQHNKLSSPPGARMRAWTSMRVMRRFKQADIEMTANIGAENLKFYVKRLLNTGYLVIVTPKVEGKWGSRNVYALVRDTGPLHPMCWKHGKVMDQNTRQTFDAEGNDISPWKKESKDG